MPGVKFVFKQLLVVLSVLIISLSLNVNATTTKQSKLTLEQIMADPDWIGRAPQGIGWSSGQDKVYYRVKAAGHSHFETYSYDLASGQTEKLEGESLIKARLTDATWNPQRTQAVVVYEGDLYLYTKSDDSIRPLIRDEAKQRMPEFTAEGIIYFLQGNAVYRYRLQQGIIEQIAVFKNEEDPDKEKNKSYLELSQPRLFDYLKKKQAEERFQKERKKTASLHQTKVWYLDPKKRIKTFRLSPNGQYVLVGLVDKELAGKKDHMPEFVTMDGYVNDRKVRPLVGTDKPLNESFTLYDLHSKQAFPLDLNKLPGINDDPLERLKRQAARKLGKKFKKQTEPRAVYAYNWQANQGVEWSRDASQLAIMLFSYDNKDRWIVTVDTQSKKIRTSHWLNDEAWVNDWTFNEFGWLPDNKTLYFLSEESGYSHLYIKRGSRRPTQITNGQFEVSDLHISRDGQRIYFKANKPHPGIYEIYKVDLKTEVITQLTQLGGVNDYWLSADEDHLLIRHSETNRPPELMTLSLRDNEAQPKQITHSVSEAFAAIDWLRPEIIAIPSTHIERNIYARLYKPKTSDNKKRPAVLFVHGAGYLQNAHHGWSGYFREYMFHNYLVQKGYVVLDMDYRASKGYGRDWRTAIYRQMGTPELEDLIDGVNYLIENENVDPKRVGIYGGSYGGFMTFMALFKSPETFAAGAALRPVTDWAHYNHGYTSNILNTPEVDPEAFERSSPIEFAEGLSKPLLIAHGMVDDNVFFKDTVRLVQRLIELHKTRYFETAIYPVEPHGFKEPDSWLDEYTRIDMLFDRTLKP